MWRTAPVSEGAARKRVRDKTGAKKNFCECTQNQKEVYAKRFFHSNHGFTVQRKGEYKEAEQMILDALAVMK